MRPGRYRHYKGKDYQVIGLARHSETEEPLVVYRTLYGDFDLWVRPLAMFNEVVEVQNGAARLPDRPGLGLTLRDDIVDAHPYEPYTRHSLFTTDGRPTPS